jgi:hypothetical protein
MLKIHPQHITDTAGKKLVVLPEKEYNLLLEQAEELNDIRMYDRAVKEDKGKRILLSDYLKKRKLKNA